LKFNRDTWPRDRYIDHALTTRRCLYSSSMKVQRYGWLQGRAAHSWKGSATCFQKCLAKEVSSVSRIEVTSR